ncbi:hypothetical protein TGAM01_v208365 [Trichoderma gamsii]|uniref:Uncharacterized protein n=1 Tax=Trichoderma gamsii TaxID=398673 RepID=A0A2P4ZEG9_9HYPO|nr:hypothetical protein TGAM01_v208365 [Trichoderma gamsii]PON22679.1 hypothetical protein TGAM01_v208365 [Trichoderma gamsii]
MPIGCARGAFLDGGKLGEVACVVYSVRGTPLVERASERAPLFVFSCRHCPQFSTQPPILPSYSAMREPSQSSKQFTCNFLVLLTQGGPRWAWRLTRVSLVSLAGSAPLPWVSETCHIA